VQSNPYRRQTVKRDEMIHFVIFGKKPFCVWFCTCLGTINLIAAFRLNVRKYVFSNRVIDNWNLLPASCIKCSTINTFKKHLSSELELEAVKFKVCQL